MKRNLFAPILLLLGLFFYVGLASCLQEANPTCQRKSVILV